MKDKLSPIIKADSRKSLAEKFTRHMARDVKFQYTLNSFLEKTKDLKDHDFDREWDKFLVQMQGRVAQR